MQFNPELMRAILLHIEGVPAGKIFNGAFHLDGYELQEVHAHAKTLMDDGWFTPDSIFSRNSDSTVRAFVIRGLSMKAHDYLANIRNDTVWKKLLAKAKADGASTSTTILNGLATALAKKYAGLE